MAEFGALAISHLTGAGPRWYPGLGAVLAEERWRQIGAAIGVNRDLYGTARLLALDHQAERDVAGTIALPEAFEPNSSVIVERLNGRPLHRYVELGLDFYPAGDDLDPHREALASGFQRLAAVPTAAAAIGAVVAVVHILRPQGPDFDVSYSDPEVPFSISTGVHARQGSCGDLRVAEGILHEAMHLQLTLIESALPLVSGGDHLQHSPWVGTMRPAQGVLHGLYVFRAIQDFFRALIETGSCSKVEARYVERRVEKIEAEIDALTNFADNRDLTEHGRPLVKRLLAGYR